MPPLHTPDGRYIVVRGRLWRATNPSLTEAERSRWVHALQDARRRIKVTCVCAFYVFDYVFDVTGRQLRILSNVALQRL